MDIDRFFKTVLLQNAEELRKFFQKNAVIKWHCTNEVFTLDEYIKANCEYPGNWNGEIERIEKMQIPLFWLAESFQEIILMYQENHCPVLLAPLNQK